MERAMLAVYTINVESLLPWLGVIVPALIIGAWHRKVITEFVSGKAKEVWYEKEAIATIQRTRQP